MTAHPLYSQALNIARKGVDLVLPARCPVTGEYVDSQGMLSAKAWQRLNFISSPYCTKCGLPFSFDRLQDANDTQEGELCIACIKKEPPYTLARSALVYDDISRPLILGYKHADKTQFAPSFAPWLHMAGREFLPQSDYLIPVPLHATRLLKRRYNQAALLAQALSKIADDIPCLPEALHRVRATPSQGHLTTKERHKNVRKAFAFNKKYKEKIKGKTLVLIDDVYTTGATITECTKALLRAGAKDVYVLTLTRVVKDYFYD